MAGQRMQFSWGKYQIERLLRQIAFIERHMWRKPNCSIKVASILISLQGSLVVAGCSSQSSESNPSIVRSACYDRATLENILPMTEIVQISEITSTNPVREIFSEDGKFARFNDFDMERGSYVYGKDFIQSTRNGRSFFYRFCRVGNSTYLIKKGVSGIEGPFEVELRSLK